MNKFLLNIFVFVLFSQVYMAQSTVSAYVKGNEGKPLADAEVSIVSIGKTAKTDKVGYFELRDVPEGNYLLSITKTGYTFYSKDITVKGKETDLGDVQLEYNPSSADVGIVTLTDDELNADESQTQSGVGLLQASRDAFSRASAFELGPYWFRPRGVDNRYTDVLFNGISMSKNDDGRIDFSNWGGLNDVTRYPMELAENITPSEYTFGNLGGVTYYNTRASSYRKGVSLAYSFTNRSYFHRVMATYNTGLTKSGWAFTASASRRWADEGVIDGTYQDSYAYFLSLEKRLGKNHALSLTTFGSPTRRASNSPNTQEAYDLLGKNYNSYWGWQDGEKRNERIRNVFEPIAMLTHYWKIGKQSNLNTTLSYQQGSDARSRLDWFRANSASPTYYRNLPSWYQSLYSEADSDGGTAITAAELAIISNVRNSWLNDQSYSQINWNNLYQANANVASAGSYNGVSYGNGITGKRAAYLVLEDVNEDRTINLNSHFDTKIRDNWKLNVNFNYQNLQSDNFRRVKDLLGADFGLNYDDFSAGDEGLFDVDGTQLAVFQGDKIEYFYTLNRSSYTTNISTEIELPRWNVTLSALASYSESQREGHYKHYLYQNNSKGKSDLYNGWDIGMKARIEFKIDGKNYIAYDGAYFTILPSLNEIFANPRVNNVISPNISNQIINSNDLSFIHRGQKLKLRVSGYYNEIKNATEIARYYAEAGEGQEYFVAEILTNLAKKYLGGEVAAEYKITNTLTATAVASYGQFTINNNPNVYLLSDDIQGIQDMGTAYMKDYHVAGTPQQAYSFGLRYNSPKFWWIGASVNYLAGNYLDISALPRTQNFVNNPLTGTPYTGVTEEQLRTLLAQKRFDDQLMLNANVGKSFLIGKYRAGISIGVNNVLNNRDYVTGGFEQARYSNYPDALLESQRSTPLFGPKLWYDRGLSYFMNVYLRF